MRLTILAITCMGSAELNALQLIVFAFPTCALLCVAVRGANSLILGAVVKTSECLEDLVSFGEGLKQTDDLTLLVCAMQSKSGIVDTCPPSNEMT
jgi:hypothetical protein